MRGNQIQKVYTGFYHLSLSLSAVKVTSPFVLAIVKLSLNIFFFRNSYASLLSSLYTFFFFPEISVPCLSFPE